MRSFLPSLAFLISSALLAATGCAGRLIAGPPPLPQGQLPAAYQAVPRCQMAASQGTPLVTEWPATEKANLEILVRQGAVAVAFSGCSMKVLSNCTLQGRYGWNQISPVSDYFEISDEDELYARLPLGAAALEGELKRWGRLGVQTAVSGQWRLGGLQPED